MKKAIKKLLILGFTLLFTMACSEDEDAAPVDLLTAHIWKLEKYFRNGNDETSNVLISNFTEEYKIDGAFIRNYIDKDGEFFNETGAWEFDSNQKQVKVTGVSSIEFTDQTTTVSSSDYNIIKLTDTEIWYSYSNGGDFHEFHFVPN